MEALLLMLGWPAIVASLVLTAVGLRYARVRPALAGVLLGTPFLLYVVLSGRFREVGVVALVLYSVLPFAVAVRSRAVALACGAPFAALAVTFAWLVVRSWK